MTMYILIHVHIFIFLHFINIYYDTFYRKFKNHNIFKIYTRNT